MMHCALQVKTCGTAPCKPKRLMSSHNSLSAFFFFFFFFAFTFFSVFLRRFCVGCALFLLSSGAACSGEPATSAQTPHLSTICSSAPEKLTVDECVVKGTLWRRVRCWTYQPTQSRSCRQHWQGSPPLCLPVRHDPPAQRRGPAGRQRIRQLLGTKRISSP